ncbi:MAG: hypothetical protein UX31_C0017G0022 [Candidatus Nomurabacteria bacterium GW2011_GWA1_46_11]|uniref:Uncharacterized protein n=1 Tax=Candidatus Nomurabacteria bacterium GW2011_GWA1_46_11 TaxID=1618732 RepID=A0A0G1QUF8_9BACT|nr:MAG: hypothetical protein UX29_C0016G0019 [Parcubacteria group bacterium GW2011_GWA2_46_10]KKU21438.1 MAG: hypothetical protein UX31_C0017G0022 [Candidatus Nomurabacteria bacterium GW2011_GWA1_46_11]
MNSYEKELIIAYFQGGNAKDKGAQIIEEVLDVIRKAVTSNEEGDK